MIKYNPKTWMGLILHSYSRHVLRTMLPVITVMGVFTTLVCYVIVDYLGLKPNEFPGTTAVHSLLGIVLGLFLVFRTNSAYDRWWEGRRQWGGVVNSTRNFALKLNAYISREDHETREWFAKMIPNFVYAMKEHLRTGVQLSELEAVSDTFLDELKNIKHKPNKVSAMLYCKITELYKSNKLSGDQMINIDKELKDFTDLIGACERIKNTPIPYSYSMFIKKFIFIYIVTLPFGFVTTFEYFTIPTVLLVSYVLLSVELIAEEIEDPFGRDINDLPTDELAGKIKDNVREILL
ncbi:bestrophin family protein [Ohtaekwangia koreensis]|nr:bestrophin family protein [Ohtaekwangia koreensis]